MLRKFMLPVVAVAALSLAACSTVDLDENAQGGGGGAGSLDGSGAGRGGVGPAASVGRTIYFDFDSFIVRDESRGTVSGNASYLRSNSANRVVLEGHTDERGSTEYNLALGQKRAEAVRQALLLLGVSEMQIEAVSYGKERPAAYGSNEEAWAKNRRVEFSYR